MKIISLLVSIFLTISSYGQATQPTEVERFEAEKAQIRARYGIPTTWPADTPHCSWQFFPGALTHENTFWKGNTTRINTFRSIGNSFGAKGDEGLDLEWCVLLSAIAMVESHGDITAKGRAGDRGLFQIRPVYWADLERIYGRDDNDSFSATVDDIGKSLISVVLYTIYYTNPLDLTPSERKKTDNLVKAIQSYGPDSAELIAKVHHMGPSILKANASRDAQAEADRYWGKVQEEMFILRQELWPQVNDWVIPVYMPGLKPGEVDSINTRQSPP